MNSTLVSESSPQKSALFPRNIRRPAIPEAVGGDGAWILDSDGRRYLDGAGGAFVAVLGHSCEEVANAISKQVGELHFAHAGDFTTAALERLAALLASISPPGIERVTITTSGSTANEAAIKLARQYHILNGDVSKVKVISRQHSYHGSTLGALSITGSMPRRKPFEVYLPDFPKVSAPYCYRCPHGLVEATCRTACADDLEAAILAAGSHNVSAFIVEPIAGAPLATLASSKEYLRRVRAICDRHNVLLIADEIVSGVGRTGDWFAVEESGVVPDIITLAKGLAAGFVPIGAVLSHKRIYETFEKAGASFLHYESLMGHVVLSVAGAAVIDFLKEKDILQANKELANCLENRLAPLIELPIVGDVRGRGLLRGLELVANKSTRQPFDRKHQVAERVARAATERGVLILSGNGAADGVNGDTVVVAPPYITSHAEIDLIAKVLRESLSQVTVELMAENLIGAL